MAETTIYIIRDAILAAARQAVVPYIGKYVMVSERGHGKSAHWHSWAATLAECYPGGLLLQGVRYRTWINAMDLWTGQARCGGEVGEAMDAAFVRLRTGGNPFAALAAWLPSA